MRKIILTGLLVLGGFGVARSSEGVDEILKLAAAGVGEDVLLAFVETSPVAYDISADEIIQLKDLGLSQTVLAAMLTRGNELRKKAAESGTAVVPPAAPQEQPGEIAARQTTPEIPVTPAILPQDPVVAQATVTQPATQPLITNAQPVYTYQPPVEMTPTTVVLDTAPVLAPPPDQYTTTFFYDALSPYGTWVSHPGYGWVWEPAAVRLNPHWRPYCDGGNWMWTDHGWYWQSDYSWGWAPFHYGRWAYIHHRWCWIPGHRWAPSWVYWRSHHDGYGWAPLPPGSDFDTRLGFTFHGKNVDFSFGFNLCDNDYVFVPRNRFLDRRLHTHALPRPQVTNIYNQTTVINNTYVYNDNRIINNGVPVESLAQITSRPIRPVKIEDAHFKPGERIHGDRRDGDRLVAFRPQVQEKVTELPPAVTQRRLASIPPSRRVTLAPPKEPAKAGPTQVHNPLTTNLAPVGSRTPPAGAANPPATLGPATGDHLGRKVPPVAVTPERTKTAPPTLRQPVDETRRRIETEAAQKSQLDTTRKPQHDAALKAQQLEATRKAELDAARRKAEADTQLKTQEDTALKVQQLEAARKAEMEAARRRTHTDAQLKAQQDAALKAQQLEAARKAELDAARHKAEADTQLKTQEDAALKARQLEAARKAELDAARRKAEADTQLKAQQDAARRKAEADTQLKAQQDAARRKAEADTQLKAQQDAALKARQLEAARKAELDAARHRAEADTQLKAQQDAALKARQLDAARKAELDAARHRAEADTQLKAQQDAALKARQLDAVRKAELDAARRRVETPATQKTPATIAPPNAPKSQVPPQSEEEKALREVVR